MGKATEQEVPTTKSVEVSAPAPLKWKIVGLKESDYMPLEYQGRTYNLASLTEEDAKFLLKEGAEKVPFLVIDEG